MNCQHENVEHVVDIDDDGTRRTWTECRDCGKSKRTDWAAEAGVWE